MIVITKTDNGWDITAYQHGKPARKAWAINQDQAIGKAEILADYYTDDNGQRSSIVINKAFYTEED